jgi:hypothetical protein
MRNKLPDFLILPTRFLVIGLLVLTASIAKGQQIAVHLNKQVFIGGSLLKYVVYLNKSLTNQKEQVLGENLYFEIADINNQSVIRWKSQVKSNSLKGEYKIPENIVHGLYFLHVYTNSSRADALASFSTPILIQEIHEEPMQLLTLVKNNSESADTFYTSTSFISDNSIEVKIEKDTSVVSYSGVTSIKVTLVQEISNAQLSVSITEITPFNDRLAQVSREAFQQKFQKTSQDYFNFDVEQGFTMLSGYVTNKNGAPYSNLPVYISFTGQSVSFRYSITDENGSFCFALDSVWNNKELLLQSGFNVYGSDSLVWAIDEKRLQLSSLDTVNYTLETNEYEYLLQLQKRELVNRIFTPETKVELQSNTNQEIDNFFLTPNYVIYPADFEPLNDFKEIADNILPAVRFKKEGDGYKMGIITEQQQVVFENVLVCLNGNPILTMNIVEQLSSADIERVEIFNSELLYGQLTYIGVVSIFTRNKNILLKDVAPNGYYYSNNFYSGSYQPVNKSPNNPVVNPEIYWNPYVTLTQDEPFSFKLSPVDIGEQYLITIHGVSDSGKPIWYQQPIRLGINKKQLE